MLTTQSQSFANNVGKGENAVTSIFPLYTMFSSLPYTNFNFSVTFILLSANAFNSGWSKILSFGNELIHKAPNIMTTLKLSVKNKNVQITTVYLDCFS